MVEGQELVLIRDGNVRDDVLRNLRMTNQELRTVLHEQGLRHVDEVDIAFVEPSGKITIIESQVEKVDALVELLVERQQQPAVEPRSWGRLIHSQASSAAHRLAFLQTRCRP